MAKFRRKKPRTQFQNIIAVTIAGLFVIGVAAGALYGFVCGNHYFTKEEVLEKIKEVNPYVVGIEKPPIKRIFEPSYVSVVLRSGETEEYRVYSNINREVTVE